MNLTLKIWVGFLGVPFQKGGESFPYENHRKCYKSSHKDRGPCYLHLQIFF